MWWYFYFATECASAMVQSDLLDAMDADYLMAQHSLSEENCRQTITDCLLSKISLSHCSKWRMLPSHLGLEKIVANDISRDFPNEEERRFQFFSKWKEIQGSDATYEVLIGALLTIDCREDAEGVCKILKTSLISKASPTSE